LKKVFFIIFILFNLTNYSFFSILKQFNYGLFSFTFYKNEKNLYNINNNHNCFYNYNYLNELYEKALIIKQKPYILFYNFQSQFHKYSFYKEDKIKNLNNTNNIQIQEQNIQEQKEMPNPQLTTLAKQNNQNQSSLFRRIGYIGYLYSLNNQHNNNNSNHKKLINSSVLSPQNNKNILAIKYQTEEQSQQKSLCQNNNNTIPKQINLNLDFTKVTIPKNIFSNQNNQDNKLAIEYFGPESQWKKNDIIGQNKLQQKNKAIFNFNQKKKLQNKNNFLLKTIKEENEQNNDNSDNISEASTKSSSSNEFSQLNKNNKHCNNKKKLFCPGAGINSKNKNFKNNNKNNNVGMRHLTKVKQIGPTQFTEYIGFNKNKQWINISKQQYNEFMNQQNKIKQN